MNPQQHSEDELKDMINEVLRRHDHTKDAQLQDVKLFKDREQRLIKEAELRAAYTALRNISWNYGHIDYEDEGGKFYSSVSEKVEELESELEALQEDKK